MLHHLSSKFPSPIIPPRERVTIAREAESESVQLRAWRAILADMIAVSQFSDLEYRMAEIEEQLSTRAEHTHPAR
jgi:hypothetical protein